VWASLTRYVPSPTQYPYLAVYAYGGLPQKVLAEALEQALRRPIFNGMGTKSSWSRGAGLLDDGSIEIEFAYRNGDEAILKAKRDTSSTAR
jgi:hypothetical protein